MEATQNRYDAHYFWQGDKTRLRPVQGSDWEVWYREATDSHAGRLFNLGIELPTSPEMVQGWTEKYANLSESNDALVFCIETLASELVGVITLHSRDEKNGRFSFGVRVYRPYRRQGYATEAVRILLRYGFHERRYQKANSACLEINTESIRLHQTLGFREEGLRRRHVYTNGRYYDDILFGLTREEFDDMEQAFGSPKGAQR
jgi:RimJ/RimL family protein N-acetyltransferase